MTLWSMKAKDEVTTHLTKSVSVEYKKLKQFTLIMTTFTINSVITWHAPIVRIKQWHTFVFTHLYRNEIQIVAKCLFYNTSRL